MKSLHLPQQPLLNPWKKRIFRIVLFMLPVVLLTILELMLGLFEYGGNLDLFIPAPEKASNYEMCNRNVGRRFFYMLQGVLPGVPKDLILRRSPGTGTAFLYWESQQRQDFPMKQCNVLQDFKSSSR